MKALKRELKLIGLTNGDLARILKVSDGAVTKWMSGQNLPRPVHVKKMVEMGISEDAAIEPSKEV